MQKKTHENYIEEVANVNPNIEVVGEYIGTHIKILHRCKIDGYEWMAKPSNILNGSGCSVCSKKKKKTHDEYVKEVNEINPDIEVVGTYINNKTKILHRCKIDGYEWLSSPHSILLGNGCSRCSKREVYGHDEYIKRVHKINPSIEVVDNYINTRTAILHRCKIDGHEWMAKPNSILNGTGCPLCAGTMLKTHEQYVNDLKIKNPTVIVVDNYINHTTKIMHKCLIHDYDWGITPAGALNGNGCPICMAEKTGKRLVKSHEEYVKEVETVDKNIKVVGRYINSLLKITHKCILCGTEWEAYPCNIFKGYGCPHCRERHSVSFGERKIAEWLDAHNIQYERQKTFDGCKDKHLLRFDFYLPNYNICIEYNGKQHYEPIEYFGGKETFEAQVLRDNIKRKYCQKNNILLFEIPYYSDLDEELARLYDLIKRKEVVA